jgi:hypothetical protein
VQKYKNTNAEVAEPGFAGQEVQTIWLIRLFFI